MARLCFKSVINMKTLTHSTPIPVLHGLFPSGEGKFSFIDISNYPVVKAIHDKK